MTTTSPTARKGLRNAARRGFTLVEVMVVVVLSSMILGGIMATYIAILKGSLRTWNYETMERQTNKALETFARDARMADNIIWTSSTYITLSVPVPSGGADRTVVYKWSSSAKAFQMVESGVTTTLVKDVQSFDFNRYNLAQAAASNDYETNQIQVTMTASPTTNGVYAQTSKRVLSARFVLRNR